MKRIVPFGADLCKRALPVSAGYPEERQWTELPLTTSFGS